MKNQTRKIFITTALLLCAALSACAPSLGGSSSFPTYSGQSYNSGSVITAVEID